MVCVLKKHFLKLITACALLSLLLTSCGNDSSANSIDNNTESYFSQEINNTDKNNSTKPEESKDIYVSEPDNNDSSSDIQQGEAESLSYLVSYKDTDITETFEENQTVNIECNGKNVTVNGNGATASDGVITISNSGVYLLSGTLSGRIIVDSQDAEPVRLILNGISVNCDFSAPLYVASADKVIVTSLENTVNTFKDATSYTYDDETNQEPSAAIFSKDDLTFNGKGTINVEASFKNGIQCKDKLKICGGIINVTAENDGIKGKDCVGINNGTITVNSKGDGIQSSNADAGNVGFVNIGGGKIKIKSELDGIQGENGVCISGGEVDITSGSGSSSTESKKGIKGVKDVTVTGGKITVVSVDDAVHSDGKINVEGGEITASSNNDGFHAEAEINIKDGKVDILRSYEGLEAAKINILGGTTTVKASDDGVNASDGSGGGGKGGFGGGGGMAANSNCVFNVSGGFIHVNAQGDGLDSNGNITISGGTVLCEGPTNGGNSSVDHNGSLAVTGGTLLSIGSNGMAGEILSSTTGTTQCIFGSYCNGTAGTTIGIKDSSGNVLLVFKTSKQFGHIVFSSSTLKTGETYEIWTGGDGVGECINGLYTNNTYNGGTKLATVSQTQTVTGGGGGMMPGGNMNPGGTTPPDGTMTPPDGSTRPQKPGRW